MKTEYLIQKLHSSYELNEGGHSFFKPSHIPDDFREISKIMTTHHATILDELKKKGYGIDGFPDIGEKQSLDGMGATLAYPIQGILKYHGMSDWMYRIAYLPSISLSNNGGYTKTYVEFNSNFRRDIIVINDKLARGREIERVEQLLNVIRGLTGSETKAIIVSKNHLPEKGEQGKGLGISAAASAALGFSSITAALGVEYTKNSRFSSIISGFLSGSGRRSATGGISLWLSYPGIVPANSYSIRLDREDQFKNIRLVSVPIAPRIKIKTEDAHKHAPNSDFFKPWMLIRTDRVLDVLESVEKFNWKRIGEIAELDSIHLHCVTMSGSKGRMVYWEDDTVKLMKLCNELRNKEICTYFSMDTGPSAVLITHVKYEDEVCDALKKDGLDYFVSEIGGKPKILDADETKEELFTSKVKKFIPQPFT